MCSSRARLRCRRRSRCALTLRLIAVRTTTWSRLPRSTSCAPCFSAPPSARVSRHSLPPGYWANAQATMPPLPMRDHVVEVHSSPSAEDVIDVVDETSRHLGLETYLVGGFVRDRLRGTPGKDIDLVTVGAE